MKATFQFGKDSFLRLLVFFHHKTAEMPYGFGGRYHRTGNPRFTDDPRQWNEVSERRYLKNRIAAQYTNDSDLKYMALVKANHKQGNPKLEVWHIPSRQWLTETDWKAQMHSQHIAQTPEKVDSYLFRLSIPHYAKIGQPVQWWNFFTNERNETKAFMELIGTVRKHQKDAPSVRLQTTGKFYGDGIKAYSTKDRLAPSSAWYDVAAGLPKYHGTTRIVQHYDTMLKANQEFEEFVSNL